MTDLKMRLKRKQNSALLLIGVLFLFSCVEEKKPEKIVARVGDAVLTESRLGEALASNRHKHKYREEYIRNWVETELLYKKALDEDIISDSLFNGILTESKKELAGAFLISKMLDKEKLEFTDNEIRDYYKKNINEFWAPFNGFVLNVAKFKSQNDAILFRKEVLKSKWSEAEKKFESNLIESEENKLIYKHEIQPVHLLRVIEKLEPSIVSIVIKTEPEVFTVVQMIDSIEKNKPIPARYIQDEIKERLRIFKSKQLYNRFMESLYEEYNVQLKRDSI